MRAKTGTRIEETAKLCDQIEAAIRKDIPAKEFGGILDNLGLPYSSINLSYSNSGVIGTADGDILVSLNPGHRPTADYQRKLRVDLPREFPGTPFFFQPSDIVNQILNFGLSAPIDIQLIGQECGREPRAGAQNGGPTPARFPGRPMSTFSRFTTNRGSTSPWNARRPNNSASPRATSRPPS